MVTGGAGFIGSHLSETLLERGAEVRVLDDLSTGSLENLAEVHGHPRLRIEVGSVRDAVLLRRVLEGCATVYHLAASVGVGLITAEPDACLRNNVEGVQTLIDATRALVPQPRVVLFSSSEVYGKSGQIPLREDADLVLGSSLIPRWSYASSKIVGEFAALAEHRRSGLPVTVVRCFNTCGPRQRSTYGMVVPRFLESALAGEPLTVYGDGRQTRCFTYVDDVVDGVLRLAENPAAAGEIVNLGTDRETAILELAERVIALAGSTSPIRLVPYREVYGDRFEDVPRRVPDLTRLRRLIGLRPPTDLDTLLRLTLEHQRNGRPQEVRAAIGSRRSST